MDKKEKRGFFIRITRREAEEKIKEKEEALGRELTKEEKHKIVKSKANVAKRKLAALVLAGATGITSFGLGYATRMLTEGNGEREESAVTTTDKESFKESLKVETSGLETPKVEAPDLEANATLETIKNELAGLDSKEDVLNYWKQLYAQEYKEMTGESLNSYIEVNLTNQSYVYQLENGQIVTHGEYSNLTEGLIKADGLAYTEEDGRKVYQVTYNNEIMDAMAINGEKVIPGDQYNELKNKESVLAQMGGRVTNCTFELIDLYKQLEAKPGNDYLESLCENKKSELAEAIAASRTSQKDEISQANATSQENSTIEEGPEL